MEPENPGNLGAIARVMKNFGFHSLVLVDPKNLDLDVARARAMHAKDVLASMKTETTAFLKEMDLLIGTTSKLGTDYNMTRSCISAREAAESINPSQEIGLLFGREGIGLKNDELLRCDMVVTIPSSPAYPALNISHAAAILLYEMFQHLDTAKTTDRLELPGRKEKEVLWQHVEELIESSEFSTPDKKDTQRKVWWRLIGKSRLTKREVYALIGFLKKFKKA